MTHRFLGFLWGFCFLLAFDFFTFMRCAASFSRCFLFDIHLVSHIQKFMMKMYHHSTIVIERVRHPVPELKQICGNDEQKLVAVCWRWSRAGRQICSPP